MARERGNKDAPGGVLDDVAQARAHGGLGGGEPRSRGVGRVREQEVDPGRAELVDGVKAGSPPIDRRLVELEVTGVHDGARRRGHEDAERSGDGVRHREEGDVERAERDGRAVLDLTELGRADVVLGELPLDDAEGELARVDGHLAREVLEQVRQRARVVLVAVRDDDATELLLVLEDVGVVREDEVDAGLSLVWEHETGVDEDHVVPVLEGGHVLADAVQASQRDDLERYVFLGHSWVVPFVELFGHYETTERR